eukprot:CAMPEP_0115010396 /NCGR_PEP_ID=MMETSP0216-20121206/23294_1 /TAXON_ID=223996 /ORGANISM="Protocruzia adherens, Strain Boccale" /LENGTH=208 /DNA_ID=CAMNT_0002378609 /DNA_START=86 /DNA_END=709 /DNA_ORIENTATION=-
MKFPIKLLSAVFFLSLAFTFTSINADTQNQETQKKTAKEVEQERFQNYIRQWQESVKNFSTTDILTFQVYKGDEVLVEPVEGPGVEITGGFIVLTAANKVIDFTITQGERVLYTKKRSNSGVFVVRTENSKDVEFRIRARQYLKVSFAMKAGNPDDALITAETLTPLEEQLNSLNRSAKDLKVVQRLSFKVEQSHQGVVRAAANYAFW